EARKALAVTSWAEKERVADFRTRTYDRELRLPSLTMVWETVRPEFSQVRPYRAVSPDSLAAFGFVRTISGDSTLYYGPDAEVLMSDVFLDTHCFQTRRGQDDARGLIGLSFEPVRGRSVPDIAGTLWLDPKTSKLEYIEFTYTGIPRNLNVAGVGGRTYFRRLPNGAWIVDRWYIRMPIPRRGWNDELVAHALLEGGGEITEVRVAGSALPRGAIRGIIYDSINNAALARALVYLSGTAHSAVTDSAGRFEIRDVPTGKHTIAFSHASFDSLPAWPPGRTVDVEADSEATVQLAVPSVASLVARVCPDAPNAGVIVGQVLDDRRELTDAVVVAKFRYQGRDRVVRARPGASGRYVLCGIPVAMRFALALNDDRPVPARMPEVGFMRVDYE
ncbi:MAG: carboxypeptidase regulatory-like domain-containing protein, partial [Gemmatimonadota bacterium]